jgi:hypothetical protein
MTDPEDMMASASGARSMLMSVSPTGDALDVPVATAVVMQFGWRMLEGMEQLVVLHEGDLAGPLVPMNRAWSSDRTTLTCVPLATLKSHTRYVIHMGAGMRDTDGDSLGAQTWMPSGSWWVMPSMMGNSTMMGSGWSSNGRYGVASGFTTG